MAVVKIRTTGRAKTPDLTNPTVRKRLQENAVRVVREEQRRKLSRAAGGTSERSSS